MFCYYNNTIWLNGQEIIFNFKSIVTLSKETGNRLKKVAEEKYEGNQSEMARHMGMSPQGVNKYFQGTREPGIKILERLVSIGINVTWVIKGIGPMLIEDMQGVETSKIEMQNGSGAQDAEQYVDELYSAFEGDDLNAAETQFLAEIKQFSLFLETRPLNPHVKRLLLELLIESIDQAIEQPQHAPAPSAGD